MGEVADVARFVEDDRLVLFFGRIWEYKGLDVFIRAAPLVSRTITGVRFLIAGQGEDFDKKYRRLIVRPDQFTVYNEWISDARRAEFFQRAAVVVLPYTSATQSGVVPVAYTYGKPVVATDVGALSECVEHGRTGLLVPPRDESALANAIVKLLQDDQLRHAMGQAGRQKLERECSPDVVARCTVAVYEQAMRDHSSAIGAPNFRPRSPRARWLPPRDNWNRFGDWGSRCIGSICGAFPN
jgi:glycosyltransferase involved in cell wall biosynthesis